MRVSTGIDGLDHILHGGLLSGRTYLVHGEPGTGKTTLGLHFLCAGEGGLLITFAQPEKQIAADAGAIGLSLAKVKVLDLTPLPEVFAEVQTYDIFSPSEVEREPTSREIATTIAELKPSRIFVDSFGQFRSLATDSFHYHRMAQSFFRYATCHGATLLIGSDDHESARDVDGVIHLVSSAASRSICVTKFRGSDFHSGTYGMRLTATGLQVLLSAA
jgi:circadian clock protein KaiC